MKPLASASGSRLLFVNPPGPRYLYRGTICTYLSKARYVWKPKDFILISGTIPPDWDVRFLDASIHRLDIEETLRRIDAESPERLILALSSLHWEGDLAFLKRLRERQPKAHLTLFGEVLLEAAFLEQARPFADAILLNPVQYSVEEKGFPGPDEKPLKAGKAVALGIPRHALFDNRRYRWPFNRLFRYAAVYTQYGCPYSCSYCTEAITSVAWRPAEGVLEELRMLRRDGYRELHLGDASFGFPKPNAMQLLKGMVDGRMGFGWSAYTYPALADRDMLELMKASGCHTLVIGIDTADFDLLKPYGRRLSMDRLRRFLEDCRQLGIDVCGDFILGFDGETEEDVKRTIALMLSLQLAYVSINIATPVIGSSLRQKARREHRLDERAPGFDQSGDSILGTGRISPARLRTLRRGATLAFYARPSYLWRRLTGVRGLEHLAIQGLEASALAVNTLRHLVGKGARRSGS